MENIHLPLITPLRLVVINSGSFIGCHPAPTQVQHDGSLETPLNSKRNLSIQHDLLFK